MKTAGLTTLLLVGVGLAAAETSAATQCLRLTNSTASIYSAISFVADKNSDLANLPLYELLAPVDKELPWLSTCLASADILTLGVGLLSDPTKSKCINRLTGSSSSSNDTSALSGSDEYFTASLCPSMNTTWFPCVNTVLVDAIEQLMTSGGDCCTDMKAKLKELLGQDLKTFVATLMTRVGDVLCSVKTYVDASDGTTKNETCGFALVETIAGGQDLSELIEMVQIPNDQACSAMKGQNFTATSGISYKFFSSQEPLDSCFAPLNLLLTDLGKLPMIADSNVSAMFDAGKCLKGETMVAWALDEQGMIQGLAEALDGIVADMKLMPAGQVTKVMRDGFKDLEADFGPMCFHLPNSADDCVYNSTVAYEFSTDSPPPSLSKDAGGSTPSGSTSAAIGLTGSVAVALATAVVTSVATALFTL